MSLWDDLSMREKAAMMRVAVKNKIFEIDKIKEAYDSLGKLVSNSEVINPNLYTPSVNLNVNPALDYVGNALESISGYEYEGNPLNKLGIDMSFDLGTTGSKMYPNGVRFVKKFGEGGNYTVGNLVDAIYLNNPKEEHLGRPSHLDNLTQSEEWANAHGYYPDAKGHRDDRVKKPAHPSHPSRGTWQGDNFILTDKGFEDPNYTLFGLNDGGQDPLATLIYDDTIVLPEITVTPNGKYINNSYDNIRLHLKSNEGPINRFDKGGPTLPTSSISALGEGAIKYLLGLKVMIDGKEYTLSLNVWEPIVSGFVDGKLAKHASLLSELLYREYEKIVEQLYSQYPEFKRLRPSLVYALPQAQRDAYFELEKASTAIDRRKHNDLERIRAAVYNDLISKNLFLADKKASYDKNIEQSLKNTGYSDEKIQELQLRIQKGNKAMNDYASKMQQENIVSEEVSGSKGGQRVREVIGGIMDAALALSKVSNHSQDSLLRALREINLVLGGMEQGVSAAKDLTKGVSDIVKDAIVKAEERKTDALYEKDLFMNSLQTALGIHGLAGNVANRFPKLAYRTVPSGAGTVLVPTSLGEIAYFRPWNAARSMLASIALDGALAFLDPTEGGKLLNISEATAGLAGQIGFSDVLRGIPKVGVFLDTTFDNIGILQNAKDATNFFTDFDNWATNKLNNWLDDEEKTNK